MATKTTAADNTAEKAQAVENTTATENAAEKANTTSETVKLIYIGPNLPKAMLQCNKIFEGTAEEIDKELANVLEKFPLVRKMLVPISELAASSILLKPKKMIIITINRVPLRNSLLRLLCGFQNNVNTLQPSNPGIGSRFIISRTMFITAPK